MKTAGHSHLKDNDLALWLGSVIDRCKPHANTILGVTLAVIGLGSIYLYSSQQSAAREAELWVRYWDSSNVSDVVELKRLADEHPTTPAGQWARLSLADVKLGQGVDDLLRNTAEARTALQDAVQAYEEVDKVARHPMLKQRAVYGLGQTYEAQARVAEAVKSYQRVVSSWPGSVLAGQAQTRLESLDRGSAKQFYDWLAKQDVKPPLANEPGTPGLRPNFDLDSLPQDPPKDSGAATSSAPSGPSLSLDPATPPKADAPTSDAPKSTDAPK